MAGRAVVNPGHAVCVLVGPRLIQQGHQEPVGVGRTEALERFSSTTAQSWEVSTGRIQRRTNTWVLHPRLGTGTKDGGTQVWLYRHFLPGDVIHAQLIPWIDTQAFKHPYVHEGLHVLLFNKIISTSRLRYTVVIRTPIDVPCATVLHQGAETITFVLCLLLRLWYGT